MTDFDSAGPAADLLGAAPMPLSLRLGGAQRGGQLIAVDAQKCWIGSGPGCTVRLRGAAIGPVHCLIVRGARETLVRRLAPDTRLNGCAFTDARLSAGDRLSVGPIEFEVVSGTSLGDPSRGDAPDVELDGFQHPTLPATGGDDHQSDSMEVETKGPPPEVSGPLNRRRARTLVRHAKELRRQLAESAADFQRTREEIDRLGRFGEEAESSREHAQRLESELDAEEDRE